MRTTPARDVISRRRQALFTSTNTPHKAIKKAAFHKDVVVVWVQIVHELRENRTCIGNGI
jgi:hypothetical protein